MFDDFYANTDIKCSLQRSHVTNNVVWMHTVAIWWKKLDSVKSVRPERVFRCQFVKQVTRAGADVKKASYRPSRINDGLARTDQSIRL